MNAQLEDDILEYSQTFPFAADYTTRTCHNQRAGKIPEATNRSGHYEALAMCRRSTPMHKQPSGISVSLFRFAILRRLLPYMGKMQRRLKSYRAIYVIISNLWKTISILSFIVRVLLRESM